MRPAFFLVAMALTASLTLFGQEQGGGGGTQGGGGGGGGTQGGGGGGTQGGGGGTRGGGTQGGSQNPFGQQQQSPVQQMPRPIFLSGKVILDNGEAPPEPVTIVRICNGQNTPETYTDRKGGFSFQVGGDPTLGMSDASVSGFGGGPGNFNSGAFGGNNSFGSGSSIGSDGMTVDMTGCELRAELPGYRSESIHLGRRRTMDNPDIGQIILHRLAGYQGAVVSATTLQAPKKARASYDKALGEMSKKSGSKPDKAINELEKAVAEYPEFAAAWTLMGEAQTKLGDNDAALASFEKAVEADPTYLRPYGPLLQIYVAKKDWAKTAEASEAVLKINPSETKARYFKALGYYGAGQQDEALAAAADVQQSPDADLYPQMYQMQGMIHSQRGSFAEAAQAYRTYLQKAPDAQSADAIKKQLNEWEVLGVVQPVKEAAAQ